MGFPLVRLSLAAGALAAAGLWAGCGDAPPTEPPGTPAAGSAPSSHAPAAPGTAAPAPEPAAAPKPPAHPETLEALFQQLLADTKRGDRAAVVALARSMLPSRDDLRRVLKEGVETEAFLSAFQGPTTETFKADDPGGPLDASVTHTEIHVHAATTEELAAYVANTTAYTEFPGGMKRFAARVAQPGRTWYAVETREPGKDKGIRYTCFTRLGNRFLLIVKPWRAIPEQPPAPK